MVRFCECQSQTWYTEGILAVHCIMNMVFSFGAKRRTNSFPLLLTIFGSKEELLSTLINFELLLRVELKLE